MPIGNDLVDLTRQENLARGSNPRLHQRVLAPSEQQTLAESPVPELTYLALWSAKEAAFKLLKQTEEDLLFSHRRFVVQPMIKWGQCTFPEKGGPERGGPDKLGQVNFPGENSELAELRGVFEGQVQYAEKQIPVIWQYHDRWLHCIATEKASDVYRSEVALLSDWLLKDDFTPAEEISIYSDASRAVRHLVKAMVDQVAVTSSNSVLELPQNQTRSLSSSLNDQLELLRFPAGRRYSPPRLYFGGEPLDELEVSLSHDGEWVAAVIGRSTSPGCVPKS